MPTQEYLTSSKVPSYLDRKKFGRPHKNTVRRWMTHGVFGVKLRYVRCGARRVTTPEWVDEFVAALEENPAYLAERQGVAHARLTEMGV